MRNLENKEKIKRVSGILKNLCGVLMVLCVVMAGIVWLSSTMLTFMVPHKHSFDVVETIATWASGLYFVFEFMALRNFKEFFHQLETGQLFNGPTVERLAAAGKWLLARWGLSFVIQVATKVFMTTQAAGGNAPLGSTYSAAFGGLSGSLAPLAIIFMAWLLREGQTLQEEQELTV